MKKLFALSLLASAPLFAAHPGQAPYELYCGACHAPDGKGISGGQFPPLANSEWVKGKPERIIEIVLHGLQGKLQVAGKDFNLAMPPHKDSLTDDQISNIISYVRSSWGHKESAVTKQQIAAMRKSTAKQKDMWQASDLLKKYPIQKPPAIRDLLSYTHLGSFKTLADLRKTKAVNAEEEKKGVISLQHAALKKKARDNYGIVWEGWLDVPRDGKYTFTYDTDDGGALTVDGKEIITRNYVGPAGKPTKKSVTLKKGRVDIKIEYYELSGQEHISLSWEGPKMKKQYLSDTKSSGGGGGGRSGQSIPVVAPAGEAIIYRNFIAGTDPRGIGVGYSEGVNLAFSADSMSLDLIWKGDFIDGGRHWVNRGQGFQPPAGEQVVTINRGIPFAILESQTSGWPGKADNKLQPLFKGYSLNKQQQPTFKYHFGPMAALDSPAPKADGSGFIRTITIDVPSPGSPDEQLYFRALSGSSVQSGGERTFTFGGDLVVNVPGSQLPPFTRENELLVPIPLTPGKHTVTIDYTWK
ncbi:PA14 domain-containing protein [Akkermansiaceae bacterium]|nr:PA14 domain-containing protein [Akkermansiaceae bacterium]